MPYNIYKVSNQYCVHKKKGDGSAGKKIGCHATMTKAKAQLRALHAAEEKELEMPSKDSAAVKVEIDATDELKETVEKLGKHAVEYVPWGVYSFADLEEAQDARAKALRIKTLSDQFTEIVSNIMASDEIEDKSAAVSSLSSEYSQLIKTSDNKEQSPGWLDDIKNTVKETMDGIFNREPEQKKQTSGFMLWKEGEQTRWLARYSTNFRDDDNPPEIISAESHRRFVDMVDNKEAPMPELWLWHTPEWRLGEADWLAYDDSGFALASGTVDRGKEIVAEQIAKQSLVGVSHGMPVESIKRDQDDPTVIVEHISAEISPLPHNRAANKMAAWVLLGDTMKEGNNMPIPDEKKQTLVDQWNMDRALLDQLEDLNTQDAEKATEEGTESKEKSEDEDAEQEDQVEEKEEVTAEDTEEVAEEEVAETEPETDEPDTMPVDEPPSRQEIADAIATVLKPYVELAQELEGRVKEMEKSDEEKVKQQAALTPSASVSALLAQQFSAIGDEVAAIDGRRKLAKSKPKEADDDYIEGGTQIPFIDKMLYGEEDSE